MKKHQFLKDIRNNRGQASRLPFAENTPAGELSFLNQYRGVADAL